MLAIAPAFTASSMVTYKLTNPITRYSHGFKSEQEYSFICEAKGSCDPPTATCTDEDAADTKTILAHTNNTYLVNDEYGRGQYVNSPTIDTDKKGSYLVSFQCEDSANNTATEIVYSMILNDEIAPQITCDCETQTDFLASLNTNSLCECDANDNYDMNIKSSIRYDIDDLTNNVLQCSSCTHAQANTKLNQIWNEFSGMGSSSDMHVGKNFLVTANVEDFAGVYGANGKNNKATPKSFPVRFVDDVPPTIIARPTGDGEFAGYTLTNVECGAAYVDAGAIAYEGLSPNIAGSRNDMTNQVDTDVGHTASDIGTAFANVFSSATGSPPTTTTNPNWSSEWTSWSSATNQVILYSVSDNGFNYTANAADVNTAHQARIVQVEDTTAPIITMLGYSIEQIHEGDTYVDANITVYDQCKTSGITPTIEVTLFKGDIAQTPQTATESRTVNDIVNDWDEEGDTKVSHGKRTYYIKYTVDDGSGNTATATRNVMVVDDTVPTMHVGSINTDASVAGNITVVTSGANIEIAANSLATKAQFLDLDEHENTGNHCNDTKADGTTETLTEAGDYQGVPAFLVKPGEFVVTYQCHDDSNNLAVSTLQRTVTIVDNTPPTIDLTWGAANTDAAGPVTQYVEKGFPYVELGATAGDDSDCFDVSTSQVTANCLSHQVRINSPFVQDPRKKEIVGDYNVTYTVTDSSGNSNTITRDVKVRDTLRPVIKVTKSATLAHLNNDINGPNHYEKVTQFPLSSEQENFQGHVPNTQGGIQTSNFGKDGANVHGENPAFVAAAYPDSKAHSIIADTIKNYRTSQKN